MPFLLCFRELFLSLFDQLSTGEIITEKPDILDKIYGISKVQQAKKKSDVKVSDKEEDTGTENTGEENREKESLERLLEHFR